MVVDLTEGWTGDLDFKLTLAGQPFPLQDGDAVSLILKTQDGWPIETSDAVSIVPPAGDGRVRFAPGAGLLRTADLLARFKVVRGTKTVFFPSGAEMHWRVRAA